MILFMINKWFLWQKKKQEIYLLTLRVAILIKDVQLYKDKYSQFCRQPPPLHPDNLTVLIIIRNNQQVLMFEGVGQFFPREKQKSMEKAI